MSAQSILKSLSPELSGLPRGWTIKVDTSSQSRIYYQKDRTTTFVHPTLGPVPSPWIFGFPVINTDTGLREPRYFNPETEESRKDDPRFDHEYLQRRSSATLHSKEAMLSGSVRRNIPGMTTFYERAEIQSQSIRDAYVVVHTIDAGDGTVGGMNGGIFVVQPHGSSQFLVEKRFHHKIIPFAKKEIEFLRKCRHGSLTTYCAAFIDETSNPKDASVYVEFCDRGSLADLIYAYGKRRTRDKTFPSIPELFIWHAFLGLADGLAYLFGGRSFLSDETETQYAPIEGWNPILHRDIKPDNILLRSRSTSGHTKYFYCILSDFGLACENDDTDRFQRSGARVGTKLWWAPELCHDPYPRKQRRTATRSEDHEFKYLPSSYRHSPKSDVWALGACIYNLTHTDPPILNGRPAHGSAMAHISFTDKPAHIEIHIWYEGRGSRKELIVGDEYSSLLQDGIFQATAFDPFERPDAVSLLERLKRLLVQGGVTASGPVVESDRIPGWATKVHDYHSKSLSY